MTCKVASVTLVLELKRCVVSDFGAAWFRISAPDGSWLLALWICDLVLFIHTCFKGNFVSGASGTKFSTAVLVQT